MKRAARLLIYVLLTTLIPLGIFLLLPTEVGYQITEQYAFTVAEPESDVRLIIMLPQSGPYQRVENLDVKWSGEMQRESHDAVDVLRLEGRADGTGALEALLTYDIALTQGRVTWTTPVAEEDLAPEAEIQATAPVLVAQAEALHDESSADGAYRMYAFTAQHLSWPSGNRIGADQSALAAYESRVGVCGEFANLMTALCRAAGIPARSISGLSLPTLIPPHTTQRRTGLHPAGAHAWVEVQTEEGWMLADPSLASNRPCDRFWFGRSTGNYLSYGPQEEHDQIYAEMVAWAEEGGEIVAAMSAPLKFVAATEVGESKVVPVVSVRKSRDLRCLGAVGSYASLMLILSLLERSRVSFKAQPDSQRGYGAPC